MIVYAVVCNGYEPPEVYSLWWTLEQAREAQARLNPDSMPNVIEMHISGEKPEETE